MDFLCRLHRSKPYCWFDCLVSVSYQLWVLIITMAYHFRSHHDWVVDLHLCCYLDRLSHGTQECDHFQILISSYTSSILDVTPARNSVFENSELDSLFTYGALIGFRLEFRPCSSLIRFLLYTNLAQVTVLSLIALMHHYTL